MLGRKRCIAVLLAGVLSALAAQAGELDLAPLEPAPKKLPRPPPWMRKGRMGTLTVKSATKGATVTVDGLDVGVVPMKPLSLPAGSHEVKLSKPGYRELSQRVQLKAGAKRTVTLTLQPAPVPLPELPALKPDTAPLVAEAPAAKSAPAAIAPAPAPAAPSPVATAGAAPSAAAGSPPVAAAAPAPKVIVKPADAPPPLLLANAGKPAPPAPKTALAAAGRPPEAVVTVTRPAVPAAAVQVASSDDAPLTKRWYFWGGAAAAATVATMAIVYALPAKYVEKRDPTQACGGACGIVVNK